jgi:hypothetical protein
MSAEDVSACHLSEEDPPIGPVPLRGSHAQEEAVIQA